MQEAQTDEWEKRWTKDAVTMAEMSRRNDVSQLRLDLKEGKKGWDLGSVKTGIAFQENYFQG